MKDQGWIKIQRQITDWEWYDDANVFRLFFHCLVKANHAPNKWRGIMIERGQRLTSYETLSQELHLSFQQIRTAINKLKSTGEITIKSTSKYSMISITNYDSYQSSNTPDNKPVTYEQQTDNKPVTTNKNEKNEKKKKKASPFIIPENIDDDTWKAFVEHRQKLKAPMTDKAKTLMVNKLNKLNGDNNEILNQSIESGWKGVFELKQDAGNGFQSSSGGVDDYSHFRKIGAGMDIHPESMESDKDYIQRVKDAQH